MKDPRGSIWRKWDLHVHTPASILQFYGGNTDDAWDKFLSALENLPPEFKVLGINDYILLDGYKRVLAAKQAGRLSNIDLLLPVIELRLDKFGGSKSALSRVNYHIIFSNDIAPELIEVQFLAALCRRYVLTPEYDSIRTSGIWSALPTRRSIEDLGRLIIESVPESERSKFGSPLVEGFNNLCVSLDDVQNALGSHYFVGKTLTAVGKTEWADIKWNDQSIADKKTIINSADLVFISAVTPESWKRAQTSLSDASVNERLLDCSDAHRYADSGEKDRLGKCFTWIKADPTFEGLRQAAFEYRSRVSITEQPPLEPLLQIRKVVLSFPSDARLKRGERTDDFCFRGQHEIVFSPYLTCLIGGRGSGKSTLLNLMHEKLEAGATTFFRDNTLSPASVTIDACVTVDGVFGRGIVEFLQQNEIEQFASDHQRLTAAIFARLRKLDSNGLLKDGDNLLENAVLATRRQLSALRQHEELSLSLATTRADLQTQRAIVDSFQNAEYTRIAEDLALHGRELQALRSSRERFGALVEALRSTISEVRGDEADQAEPSNAYEEQIRSMVGAIERVIEDSTASPALQEALAREDDLQGTIQRLRLELEAFLSARGLSPENVLDAGRASERIFELEQEVASVEAKVAKVAVELAEFSPRRDAAEAYIGHVARLLAPINEALRGQGLEVKPIELKYTFDEQAFGEAMVQYVAGEIGSLEGRAPRPDYLGSKLGKLNFGQLSDRNAALSLVATDDGVYARAVRDFLSSGANFEVLMLEAELQRLNVSRFGRISVLYDGKPVESSSFGQRCTAVIVVLLLLGNTPVVIDEPEAHLDSALIARYLVELIKGRKIHRQIIFASHNANLVINGDAELVHCLSMDDAKLTRVVSTTIENLEHRELLLSLEGGKQAFHQRERRYGFD